MSGPLSSNLFFNSTGGASLVSIDNSVLFDGAGSLTFTPSTTETNGKKYTHSLWANHFQLTNYTNSGYNDYIYSSATVVGWPSEISFFTTDGIYVNNTSGTTIAGYKQSTAVYRDLGAWYHIFVVFDSTNTVAGDRLKLFVNGKRVTDFVQDVDPGLDSITSVGKGSVQQIYGTYYNALRNLNGRLAELYFVDGTALNVTDFGEYDSTGLYWTPKDPATIADNVTYGNNGWYLNFSNASDLGEDFSGNNNDFTASGLTQSLNTPTNQYPYQNPLTLTNSYPSSLTKGNLKQTGNSAGSFASGTLATLPCYGGGKFYWEIKVIGTYTTNGYSSIGIAPMDLPRFDNVDGNGNFCLPGQQDYQGVSTTFNTGTTTNLRANSLGVNSNIGSSYTVVTGAFMQIAFDSSNGKVWFGKNNTWYNSGDPANGTNPTVTLTATDKFWYPWIGTYTASDIFELNYGESNFEYTPPTDFNKITTTQIASDISRTASDTNKYFETILYEGDGNGQRVGQFQPFGDLFTVAKSSLFDDANSESLTRAFSTPTSANVWTFSTWLKRGELSTGVVVVFAGTYNRDLLLWNGGDNLHTMQNGVTGIDFGQTLEDSSQWFHVVWSQNGTTTIGYINGVQVATDTETNDTINENSITHYIGNRATSAAPYDGYMAETVFIDGSALTPSSFGQTDTSTNRWIPKDVSGLTFGNNGFYLNYANSSDVGNDVSGNNNDWTNNNTVLQSTDSPTTNFATLDATQTTWGGAVTLSAGNLTAEGTTTTLSNNITSTLTMYSGKYVYAFKPDSVLNLEGQAGIVNDACYIARPNDLQSGGGGTWSAEFNGSVSQFAVNQNGTRSTLTPNSNYEVGDYIIVALDVDNLLVWLGHYDASTDTTKWYNSVAVDWTGNPATGTGGSPIYGNWFKFSVALYSGRGGVADFGQNSLLSNIDIPTGFNYLTQDNITSSDQFISAFSWIKNRDATDNHMLFDRVRGPFKDIHSNTTDSQVTNSQTVQSFLAGGVQVGNDVQVNTVSESFVLWNWMIEATGSGSANTAGSVNTTSTLDDTKLGLSISQFECPDNSSNFTIGHGLGAIPKVVLLKSLDDSSYNWSVFHASTMDNQDYLKLNTNSAQVDNGADLWGAAVPTSTLIGITANVAVAKNTTCVSYAFADSQFISIGSYKGNANANGTFRPTLNSLGIPIQPVWVLIKNTASAQSWWIRDTVRNPFNIVTAELHPDLNNAEYQSSTMDIVTGGLKQRVSSDSNADAIFVYMAIGTPLIDTDGRIIAGR